MAVIYTHSHADHFGGVLGVTTQENVDAGRCRIIAPQHFLRETVAENVIAGFAMNRRGLYQFGALLQPGPRTHVDCGLGKAIPLSPPGLIAPTEEITYTGEELVVDGVRIVFQLTPETEAPAEMNFFFPDRDAEGNGWLCMAENCSHNLHNLVPIRGAQVRNSLNWAKYIDEALRLFGDRTSVMFASHHWPRWGGDDVGGFLRKQRDMYRYIHDQTMRHANHGLTPLEIAELLELPERVPQRGPHHRLLRPSRPQREGRLPALPQLVRRQSRQPLEAATASTSASGTSRSPAVPTLCSHTHASASTAATTAGWSSW